MLVGVLLDIGENGLPLNFVGTVKLTKKYQRQFVKINHLNGFFKAENQQE